MATHDAPIGTRELSYLLKKMSRTAEDLDGGEAISDAFPGPPAGNVAGLNGLYRTNWFNGRFLTADAFRADQIQADTRARMVAQIHPPGLAWGLTLEVIAPEPLAGAVAAPHEPLPEVGEDLRQMLCRVVAAGDVQQAVELAEQHGLKLTPDQLRELCGQAPAPEPQPDVGWPLSSRVALAPGLAFDDLGRPISVGARFEVSFTDLVNRYRTRPTVVIGGSTAFAPCTCVQTVPPEAVPPGASLPEGPYLLVITPIEVPEGQARRSTNPCAGRSDAGLCDAEGWRGGFELSLTRLRIQIPAQSWSTPWDLRGLISGWYFDIYEHDLRTRWGRAGATKPLFPRDPERWAGPGPHTRVESAVPLALVYVGPDGTVWFLDQWIPRRPITSTGSRAWADNATGAPTPAARVARVHQFQSMLNESLDHIAHGPTIDTTTNTEVYGPNLYERGFRHIPPWGILPVREPPAPDLDDPWSSLLSDAGSIRQAKADAAAYFEGTNVYVHSYVAIHDDDVLEDILRADPKDPIVLRPHDPTTRHADLIACLAKQGDPKERSPIQLVLLVLLQAVLRRYGDVTLDQLVNRELDAVKLLIPMDPAQRELAVVGQISSDPLAGLWDAWSEAADTAVDNPFTGLGCEARSFVVYVKHRLVWLEVIYLAVDLILDLMQIIVRMAGEWLDACIESDEAAWGFAMDSFLIRAERRSFDHELPTVDLVGATVPLRKAGADNVRSMLAMPGAHDAVIVGLAETFPELGSTRTWSKYDEAKTKLGTHGALRRMADEHQGFGVLRGAALLVPEDVLDGVVTELATRADDAEGAEPLKGATFHREGYVVEDEEVLVVNGALEDAYRARRVAEVAEGAPGSLTMGDVLDTPARVLPRTVGSPGVADHLVAEVRRDADRLLELAPKLAKSTALKKEAFYEGLREATEEADGDILAGLDAMAEVSGSKTAARTLRGAAETLGTEGTRALVERLERVAKR